jgi:hypothetical protein
VTEIADAKHPGTVTLTSDSGKPKAFVDARWLLFAQPRHPGVVRGSHTPPFWPVGPKRR